MTKGYQLWACDKCLEPLDNDDTDHLVTAPGPNGAENRVFCGFVDWIDIDRWAREYAYMGKDPAVKVEAYNAAHRRALSAW